MRRFVLVIALTALLSACAGYGGAPYGGGPAASDGPKAAPNAAPSGSAKPGSTYQDYGY